MTRKLESKGHCYVACEIRIVTAKAVLIHDGAREAWIPKSQIEDRITENAGKDPDEFEVGEHVELLLPEWLATAKGLL